MSAYICVYTCVLLHPFVYSYELISFSFSELAFSLLEKIGRGKGGPCVFGKPKRCVSVAETASCWNYMNHLLSGQKAFQQIEGPSHSPWAMPVTRDGGGHTPGTRVYYLM